MVLARHLRKAGLVEFNAREARREIGGRLREAPAMEAACRQLVEAGLIRPRFIRAGRARRAQGSELRSPSCCATGAAMSKWLARALAGKDGLACANSVISANSSQIEASAGSIGTIGTIGTAPAISRDDWQAHFDERAGIRSAARACP
jgi:hypothetical protein